MNKTYRCDFCEHDRPTTNELCSGCVHGSCFELKKRMSQRQSDEWCGHRKLDKFLDTFTIELLPWQRDFMHRIIETPCPICLNMRPRIPYSHEIRRARLELLNAIRPITLEEEADDGA